MLYLKYVINGFVFIIGCGCPALNYSLFTIHCEIISGASAPPLILHFKRHGDKMKNCYIICAGEGEEICINKNEGDFVIAVDAGFNKCKKNGITPDLIIGDFDSLGFIPEEKNVITMPVRKDDTDTFAAVKVGLKKGFERFIFYAASGGIRPEHTYANMSLLAYISKKGKYAFMDCSSYTITAVTDGKIMFPDKMKGDISVFSFDNESHGVTEKGLEYSLDNVVMYNTTVTGISNSFTGRNSSIEVKSGTLIIYYNGRPDDAAIVNSPIKKNS